MVAAFSYIIKKCIPPHLSRYTLGTFSRSGEGFYRYALCKKLGCSCQLPHSTTPDSCIQLCPPVARRCNRRRLAKPDQGGKQEANGGKLAFIRAVQAFTCHGEYYPAIFLIRLAIRSAPSPVWEKAFIVMRFARNLAVLLNYRSQRSLIFTPNKRPRGTPMQSARAGEADQGGKQETNGGKLAFLRAVQAFTCHGGGAAVPPSSFISLTFTSQRSLLWYFLGLQESTVPPRPSFRPLSSPLVPHPLANLGCLLPRIAVT